MRRQLLGSRRAATGKTILIVMVAIAVILAASLIYTVVERGSTTSQSTTAQSSSTSTSQSRMDGIVTGYVYAGPSCTTNQSACTENLSSFGLEFVSVCGTVNGISSVSCQEQTFSAPIAPSGHFSILLAPGDYSITGLSPSCPWAGCSSAFPKAVTVDPGQQLVVSINIDTASE